MRTCKKNLAYYSNWGILMLNFLNEPFEVAIMGEQSKDLVRQMIQDFRPNVLVAGDVKDNELEILRNRYMEGDTIIYVCRGNVCQKPVKTIAEAIQQLES